MCAHRDWRHAAEDVRADRPVLAAGRALRPQDVGALLALGITSVPVARRLRVGIVSGGDELVPPGCDPAPGQGARLRPPTLDLHLRRLGIESQRLRGHEREEFTHLAVGAAVASGAAHAGLAILTSARALDLDFVPLFSEEYQRVIPREYYESDVLAPLLEVVRDPEFQAEVHALGGYDVSRMGQLVWESA